MTKRPGVVLLLSLLMMAAVTASTITVSVLMNNDYEQTRSLDQFTAATLAADAGIERGLVAIKTNRLKGVNLATTISDAAKVKSLVGTGDTSFAVTASEQNTPPPITLSADQYYQFDILDMTANFLNVAADPSNICTNNCGIIETSWTVIDQNGNSEFEGRSYLGHNQYSPGGSCFSLTQVYTGSSNILGNISNAIGYRVKIRALNLMVPTVVATPSSGCPVTSGNTRNPLQAISLSSEGTISNVTSTKKVDAVWQPTSSGVFNYVLFTEGNIMPAN